MPSSSSPFPVLVHGSAPLPASCARPVLAIGNFDGVHRGHRAVFAAAQRMAQEKGVKALALTFEPHPRSFFNPASAPFRLTPEAEKLALIGQSGLAGSIVLPFDTALASLGAEDFVRTILVERYQISGAVVGFDFHFGKGRSGSPAFLKEAGARYGFDVTIVEALLDEGDPISSTTIRRALAEGQVGHAAHMLGRPFRVSAPVQHGQKLGRDLGFPTANLALGPDISLAFGIYAVRVHTPQGWHDGVASYGRRPTFDNGAALLEVHIFDFTGDLYGETLQVDLISWLRPELKFDGVEALVEQIREDARRAREILEPR
ncbi:bifunctional riboflavin kinase/FAD synthetase [Xanthobacter sp. TB0136]|uniref:bifunctional riboflavin kinase/FAD synthetase n=1 Tax=Xanthobacter sp. TB0136 TaxID=3459177 RepID=UPI004039405C